MGIFLLNGRNMFMEEGRMCCLRKEKHSGFSSIYGLQSVKVVALTPCSFGCSCCRSVQRLKYMLRNSESEMLTLRTWIVLEQSMSETVKVCRSAFEEKRCTN